MKVILLNDVKTLGKKDAILEVSEGYANNFLIKKGLAIPADNANMNILKSKQKQEERRKQDELEEAKSQAEILKKYEYKILTKAGAAGKTFGSITNAEIANEIEKVTKLKIDKRKIVLKETIKMLGIYEITVKLHPEVSVNIKIEINV